MQGPATFNTFLEIFIFGGSGQGLFVYQPAPGAGNLIASITNSNHDSFGNVTHPGITSTLFNNLYVQMNAGRITFGTDNPASTEQNQGAIIHGDATNSTSQPSLLFLSPQSHATGGQAANVAEIVLFGTSQSGTLPRVMLFSGATGNQVPVATTADVEVRGLLAISPSATGLALEVQTASNTQSAFTVDTAGAHSWGPGNAATDVTFSRTNAGQLESNGAIGASGQNFSFSNFYCYVGPSTNVIFGVGALFAANNTFQIDANGSMSWGAGGANALDVFFGRPATAGFLRVTGGLQVTNLVEIFNQAAGATVFELVVNTETSTRFNMINTGQMNWGPGGGSATDVTLERLSAGVLGIIGTPSGGLNINSGKTGNIFSVGTGPSDFAGTVYIEDSTLPATPGTASAIWSKTGILHFVGEDGVNYSAGESVQTFGGGTFTVATTIASLAISGTVTNTYAFRFRCAYNGSAATNSITAEVTYSGTTSGTPQIEAKVVTEGTTFATANGGGSTHLTIGTAQTGPVFSTTVFAEIIIEGHFTVATAGTLAFVLGPTAGSLFTKGGELIVWPQS